MCMTRLMIKRETTRGGIYIYREREMAPILPFLSGVMHFSNDAVVSIQSAGTDADADVVSAASELREREIDMNESRCMCILYALISF